MGWQPAPKGGNGNKRPFGGNQSGGEKKPNFDSPGGGKGKGKGSLSSALLATPNPSRTPLHPAGADRALGLASHRSAFCNRLKCGSSSHPT
jgi:hypothetical protein